MKKYILSLNGKDYSKGIKEEIKKSLLELSKGKDLINMEGEVIDIDNLIVQEESVKISNKEMLEMGDDWIDIEVREE